MADSSPLTDERWREHTAYLERRLEDFRRQNVDSRTMFGHLDRGWMRWSTERRAHQRHLLRQLWDEYAAHVPRAGKAFVLGSNDSGERVKILADSKFPVDAGEYLVVDAFWIDQVMAKRNMIPHVEGFSPMEASLLVREESCQLAHRLAARAYPERRNVLWLVRERATQQSLLAELDQPRVPADGTIRSLVDRFQGGGMEFPSLIDALMQRWRQRPERVLEPAGWAEIYGRAEQIPDDDDLVWVSIAEDVGALSVEQSEKIFTALESAAGDQTIPAGNDDVTREWRYRALRDEALIRVAEGRRSQRYWDAVAEWLPTSPGCVDWADTFRDLRVVDASEVAAIVAHIDQQPGGAFRDLRRFWEDQEYRWSVEAARKQVSELEASIADKVMYDNWQEYQADCDELARIRAFIVGQ